MMLMMMLMIKLICACVLRREAGSSKVLFENMKVELEPEVEFSTYMFTCKNKNAYVLFVAKPTSIYSGGIVRPCTLSPAGFFTLSAFTR